MNGHLALPAVAALALAAWLVSLPLRADQQPPQPGTIVTVAGNLLTGDSGGGLGTNERVVKVFGVAAPGLLAGMAFPR